MRRQYVILALLVSLLLLGACSTIEQCLGPQPGCTAFGADNDLTGNIADNTSENDSAAQDDETLTYEDLVDRALNNVQIDDIDSVSDTSMDDDVALRTLNFTEGEVVALDVEVIDPDGDEVTLNYSEPIGSDGTWQTQDGDEGTYLVTVTASDGVLTTREQIRVIVKPSNKGPVIDCPTSLAVAEGDTVDLDCTLFDREGDEVTYEIGGDLMNDFTYETTYDDAGDYEVVITASDGNRQTTHTIAVTIENTNRAPTFEVPQDVEVTEDEVASLDLAVDDPDGDEVTISYPEPFNTTGDWQTTAADIGIYKYDVEVTDGQATVLAPVTVIVNERNDPPVIQDIGTITVKEGELITLPIDIEDEDAERVNVTIGGFMTTRTYQTTYEDAGEYEVTITADDGVHTTQRTVVILIENVNRPPVFVGS